MQSLQEAACGHLASVELDGYVGGYGPVAERALLIILFGLSVQPSFSSL